MLILNITPKYLIFKQNNICIIFFKKQKAFNEKIETRVSYIICLYMVKFWTRLTSCLLNVN